MIGTAVAALQRMVRSEAALARVRPGTEPPAGILAEEQPALQPAGKVVSPPRRSWPLAVAGAFVLSRIAYVSAGVRFDDSALHPANAGQVQWQLLPLNLLHHDLGRSIWNLHSQPPLYNLFCGMLLHLPSGWERPVAASAYAALGLVLALATFALLDGLGTGRKVAFALTLLLIADPSMVLYENWLSWSYPTAVLATVGMLFVLRWLNSGSVRWAAAAMACFSAVVLLDATFQWPWLMATGALVVIGRRRQWRRCLAAIALPVVLTAGWYAKGAVQFGTTATSSWLGMNLYQSTLQEDRPGDITQLVRSGRLDPLAETPGFSPVRTYVPRFAAVVTTGVPAMDQRTAEHGVPNFDNAVYLGVSRRYLRDDLSYIGQRPARYASAVSMGAELWGVPADQYGWVDTNADRVLPYARMYDAAVMMQPSREGWRASAAAELQRKRPPAATISWTVAAITVVDLLLAPAVLVLGRRRRTWLFCGSAMWLTVLYSFVVTSLTEVGENMRFRFELGTIPVVLAAATISALATMRRCAADGSSTGL